MTWQNAPLSDDNKAFIYCAWAGNAAFSSAYGSWSGLGACSPSLLRTIFANNASLRTAAQEYNADAANATAIYGPISSWGVSAITSMYQLFYNLGNFNADVSAWNTSGVTDMSYMFSSASAFNQPLSLDTSSVTTMESMFYFASAFNQPLSLDTSSVANMASMFYSASAFNQPLSLDTSSVTDILGMFFVRLARELPLLCVSPSLQLLSPPRPSHAHLPPPPF